MKIALVNKYWFLKGGAERVVFLTYDGLRDRGYEVAPFGMAHPKNIISLKHKAPFLDTANPSILNAPKIIYNRQAKNIFAKFIEQEKPDIIHLHNIYHQLSFSLFDVARQYKIPTVLTLHDYQLFSPNYMLFHHGKPYYRTLGKLYYHCIEDVCMGTWGKSVVATVESYWRAWYKNRFRPNHLIAPSTYMQSVALQCGYKDSEVTFIPNPLPPIKNINISTESFAPYMVFVGRFVEEKGIKILLEVFNNLPDIKLVLVGDGPCMSWVKQYISEHCLTQVDIRGWCDEKTTQQIVSGAVLSIFPSQWPENCPMALLESLQLGVLPVGSAIGGLIELLHPSCQFTYNRQDEIIKMIRRMWSMPKEQRARLVLEMQQSLLPRHASDIYFDSLVCLYSSVCGVQS